jgi:hypothetical protein
MLAYTVKAYSKSRNQTQRELDEDALKGRHETNAKIAQMKADSLALRLNKSMPGAPDWVGIIELEKLGL